MSNHENNGHGNSHDDHETEGNRQYYPKGWWIPIGGLLVIALGFAALGTFIFSHSGTDRWGKSEQCDMKDGKCCDDKNCKEGDEKDCKGGSECKDEKKSPAPNAPVYRYKATIGW
jgi:hypothetical protein